MRAITLLVALAALPTAAAAQSSSRTFYDGTGKVTARSSTGTNGTITTFGADGRVIAREATTPSGATTVYDASGRAIARTTREQRR